MPRYGRTYNVTLEMGVALYRTPGEAKTHHIHRTPAFSGVLEVEFRTLVFAGVRRAARIHPNGTIEEHSTG